MQPLYEDEHGTMRFKENAIVRHLLDYAQERGHGMNDIARLPFTDVDSQQFAQLIGYSLSGYGDLPYVTDYEYDIAEAMANGEMCEKDARILYLENQISELRKALREPMAELFGVHPDDLQEQE